MRAWNGGRILQDSLAAFAASAARRRGSRPGYKAVQEWVTPSQFAEYVFCPEAHRLRADGAAVGPRRRAEGAAGHENLLVQVRRSQRLAPARILLWLLVAAGSVAALLAVAGRL
ncbi:MAG: hypothetical protein ACYDBQ_01325 [Thermoplasmatota archaeon]